MTLTLSISEITPHGAWIEIHRPHVEYDRGHPLYNVASKHQWWTDSFYNFDETFGGDPRLDPESPEYESCGCHEYHACKEHQHPPCDYSDARVLFRLLGAPPEVTEHDRPISEFEAWAYENRKTLEGHAVQVDDPVVDAWFEAVESTREPGPDRSYVMLTDQVSVYVDEYQHDDGSLETTEFVLPNHE
jgi:hypothetical protein